MNVKTKVNLDLVSGAELLASGQASGSPTSTTMGIARENNARFATQNKILTSRCDSRSASEPRE